MLKNPSAIDSDSLEPLYFLLFFSADATMCLILPTKSWKNHPQKLLKKTQIHFFSLLPWAAQTAQTEELCSKLWLIDQLYIELD